MIVSPHVATGVAARGGYRVVGFVLAIWEKPPPENAGSSVGSEGARPGIPFEREQNVGIYGGIAFAGLLALVFGRASRRHP